jgi:hypothetical protein
MRRFWFTFLAAVLVLPLSLVTAVAQEATPAAGDSLLAGLGYEEIRVTTDGTTNDFPSELEAGRYRIVLENTGDVEANLEIFQLPEGLTLEQMTAGFEEAEEQAPPFVPPDFFFDLVFNGGPSAFPGETASVVLDLNPGEWTANLYSYDETTDESSDNPVTVTVTGEMPQVDDPEGHVAVGMVDMDFVVPDTLEAGPQIWHVSNNGLQVHHIVFSRVPEGTTEDEVMELASTFFGPPAAPATPGAAATPVIQPTLAFEDIEDVFFTPPLSRGQFNLFELDVAPGTYAMICFMPDPSGTAHVMLGMVEIVTVD